MRSGLSTPAGHSSLSAKATSGKAPSWPPASAGEGVHQLVRQWQAGALRRAADHVDQAECRRCRDGETAAAQQARQRVMAQRL